MLKIEKTVFISYRRTNIGFALAIHQNLTHRGYDVFFDYESIGAGDFEQIILRSIEGRAHFVVILTPSALERCNEPGDWLRREIEHALLHKRNIIPLTFEGFDFKDMARYLPAHIAAPFSRYNALSVPVAYFDEAMTKLMKRLNIELDTVLHPPSAAVQNEEVRQQLVIAAEPSVSERTLRVEKIIEQCIGLLLNRNASDALAEIEQAIVLDPNSAEAYACRARAKSALKRNDEALEDINQALMLQPINATAYYARGNVKRDMGDSDSAIADYDTALSLNLNFTEVYIARGITKRKKGDYEGAIGDYDQALYLGTNEALVALVYRHRATAKADKGDNRGAIADNQKYLDLGGGQLYGDRLKVERTIRDLQMRLSKVRPRNKFQG